MPDSDEFGAYEGEDLDADNPLEDILAEIETGEPEPVSTLTAQEVDEVFADEGMVDELNQAFRGTMAEEQAIRRAREYYQRRKRGLIDPDAD